MEIRNSRKTTGGAAGSVLFSLDESQCVACAICADICTREAFAFDRHSLLPQWNADRCNGCGECAIQCPTGAIAIAIQA